MTTRLVPISCGHGPFVLYAYALIGDRVVLVDSGMPGSADRILGSLAEHGIGPCDISLIALTHAHIDHTGSAAALAEKTGAPIAVHHADAPFLRAGTSAPVEGRSAGARFVAPFVKRADEASVSAPIGVEPTVLLSGGESLDAWGVGARVLATPGHTDGSVSIVTDDGDVIVGDLLTARFTRPSTPGPGIFVTDMTGMARSIAAIMQLEPRATYASHSAPFTLARMRSAFA